MIFMCFIYKLLNELIDCPELLSGIKLTVPSHSLLGFKIFYIGFHPTKCGMHSSIERPFSFSTEILVLMFLTAHSRYKSRIVSLYTQASILWPFLFSFLQSFFVVIYICWILFLFCIQSAIEKYWYVIFCNIFCNIMSSSHICY